MTKNPGILGSIWNCLGIFSRCCLKLSIGKKVAPICWVIPPASPSCTFVLRSLSRIFVLPVST